MNHNYESPKNKKKTNPIEYNYYENIKERHYLGKYKPDTDSIGYKNSKLMSDIEIESFNFNGNSNHNNKISNCNNNDNNGSNKLKYAIKSVII